MKNGKQRKSGGKEVLAAGRKQEETKKKKKEKKKKKKKKKGEAKGEGAGWVCGMYSVWIGTLKHAQSNGIVRLGVR